MAKRKEHEQAILLLPWYVNNTLMGRDADLVLRHLAHCEKCQKERDRLYELQQIVCEPDVIKQDSNSSYQKVLTRIDVSERNKISVLEVPVRTHMIQRFSVGLKTAAIAASVLALVIGGTQFLGTDRGGDEFRTLSIEPLVPAKYESGRVERLALGFKTPIPAITLRKALIETGSNIVSGPDEKGSYIVELVVPKNTSSAVFLNQLQQIDGVEYADFTSR
ncbi:MAG: zf-HC2 domain-containing protein [Gammaproteobacteria bacterium]|nr:zf-HC2 domain-containing protein [Gammaproteobacteria bacterium]